MKGLLKKQIAVMLAAAMLLQSGTIYTLAAEEEKVSDNEVYAEIVSKNGISGDGISVNAPAVSSSEIEEPAGCVSEDAPAEGPDETSASSDAVIAAVSEDAVSENETAHPMGYIEVELPDPGRVSSDPNKRGEEAAYASYPKKYAPIDKLPPTRAQEHGTCWTYGTQAMVEADLIRSGFADKSIDTSEMHVAYFSNWSNKGTTDPLGGTEGDTTSNEGNTYLDDGGNYIMSLQNLANWSGSVNDKDVISETKATNNTTLSPEDQYLLDKYHVQGIYVFPTAERDTMKKYIYENGAVGIAYCDSDSFYNDKNNSFYCPNSYTTNHAVSVVGWDDDFSASKFRYTPQGDGAWLVRNSWSTKSEYSHYAYFWMSYYDKSLHNVAYAVDAEPASNYRNNYQYDGDTIFSYDGISAKGSVCCANIFEVKANDGRNERLDAVGFETFETTNADYDISVYKNVRTASNPESGTLCAVESGTTTANGYYTVKLSKQVELEAGTKFSVVVKLSKSGEKVAVAVENSWIPFPGMSKTIASEKNQSFYKTSDSGSFMTTGTAGNVRIKAYTNNLSTSGDPEDPDGGLLGIKLEASRQTLRIGQTTTITASPVPKTADLGDVSWSSSNTRVATVNSSGRVTAVAPGEASISAKSGSVTAKIDITVVDNVITTIRPDRTSLYLYVGDEFTLIADVVPAEMSDNVEWSSSNTSVATVTNGRVKALSAGDTEITLKARDKDGKSAVCQVTVYGSEVEAGDEKVPEKSNTDIWVGSIGDCYYTGAAVEPSFNVYYGRVKLYRGQDYTVSYKNNKAVGQADSDKAPVAVVKFKGNYSGELSRTFNIIPAPLSEKAVVRDMAEAYTGRKINFKPVIINKDSGLPLKADSDFTLKISAPDGSETDEIVDEGDYNVTLQKGSNECYSGTTSFKLTVASGMTNVSAYKVKVTNTTYTDNPGDVNPVYTVTEGKKRISSLKYIIAPEDLVIDGKGMATTVMRGVPKYNTCGTRLIKFKVTPAIIKLTKNNVKASGVAEFIYEKGGLKPYIYLTYNGEKLLFMGSDFTASYSNTGKIYLGDGTYDRKAPHITVKGKGRYQGTLNYWYNIYQQDINNLDIQIADVPMKKSKNFRPNPNVTIYDLNGKKLSKGTDFTYTVEKPDGALSPGDELQVVIKGKGNYKGEIIDRSFRIVEAENDLAKAKITFMEDYAYTGNEIRPSDIVVMLGKEEIGSSCYEIVRYSSNVAKGTGSITIHGKNGYGGYKTQTFKINVRKANRPET